MGLGSGAGLEIEAGSGLDGFEEEGSGEEGVDDLAGEGEEVEGGDEVEVEGGEIEEGTREEEDELEGMYYDGSFYNENEDDEEAMRLAGIRLGTYYQQGEGEEGMVRLVGVEGVEGVESMEGLPLEVDRDEEGEGVVVEEVLTNLGDGDNDNDNDFMVMKTTPPPEPIETLSPTIKKTPSEPSSSKTSRTTPRFSPPPPPPPPVPAIGPLFVRDGDAEWLVLTTDTVLADPLLRKYLPSQRRPYSFRLPLPLPFHTPR